MKVSAAVAPREAVDSGKASFVATAAEADALATACMVMGPEKAREFIESRPDVEGYLITSEGVWASSGFRLEE